MSKVAREDILDNMPGSPILVWPEPKAARGLASSLLPDAEWTPGPP